MLICKTRQVIKLAKLYGDIACVKLENVIHITKDSTKCLCGKEWCYGRAKNRTTMVTSNLIWRSINAVNCKKCAEQYPKSEKRMEE